jgi:hypothetical protein
MHTSAQAGWFAIIIGFVLFALIFCLRYRGGKWREIRVINDAEIEPVPVHEGFHEVADL